MRNEALQGVTEESNPLQTIKRRKANWIAYTLRGNYVLKHEGRIGVTERRGRRRKQLMVCFKEKTVYWK